MAYLPMRERFSVKNSAYWKKFKARASRKRALSYRYTVGGPRHAKLKALVHRIATAGTEVKHVGQNVVDARFNTTISGPGECYPICPNVTEGTDGHQRIGDKIKPKYMIVKGKLMYDTSMAGNYIPPSTVRLLILSQKNIKVSSEVQTAADTSHLLKDNIGTDVARPYNSSNFDNLAPINKDLFVVHMDRKVKMRAQIEKNLGDNNTVLGYATQKTVTFVKKIRVPSTLTFDDGNGNQPNNYAPFFCLGAVPDDDSGAMTVSTPYRCTVQAELYFTDQ